MTEPSEGRRPASAIRLDGVVKQYPGSTAPAVQALSLDMPEGELVALVGPSGCGKTTILKMINRLIEPTAGEISVQGRSVESMPRHELRRGIGYVIQQIGLFPHRTIAANIATVPGLLGWSKERIQARVDELSELLHLDRELLDRYPVALSGGQQQRVGVARALAADPPVLLMDEPYSAVDPIVRARLQDELLSLQERLRKTIVLVTHDIDEAIKMADRVVLLNVGGRLEQVGPPEEILRAPASEFVEDFLGGDRNLRRMGLLTVDRAELAAGPVVEASADRNRAQAVMAEHGVDWVAVTNGGALLGWVAAADLNGSTVAEADPHPFRSVVRPDTALRSALDAVVEARTRVAVVMDDDDRYLGMLTIEEIAEALR